MPPQNSQFPNSTPPILNPNKKDNKFVLLLVLGLILIAINIFFVYQTYFQNTEVVEDEQNLVVDEPKPTITKLKVCPDEWIQNNMPMVGESNEERQYYILNGERKEIAEFDAGWVGQNCNLEKQIVY